MKTVMVSIEHQLQDNKLWSAYYSHSLARLGIIQSQLSWDKTNIPRKAAINICSKMVLAEI